MSFINNATIANTTITIKDLVGDFMCEIKITIVNADNSTFTVSHLVPKPLVDYIISKNYTKQQIIDMLNRQTVNITL